MFSILLQSFMDISFTNIKIYFHSVIVHPNRNPENFHFHPVFFHPVIYLFFSTLLEMILEIILYIF